MLSAYFTLSDLVKPFSSPVVGILRYIRHYYGKKSTDFILDDIAARWNGLALLETRDLALKDDIYIKDYFAHLYAEPAHAQAGSTSWAKRSSGQ